MMIISVEWGIAAPSRLQFHGSMQTTRFTALLNSFTDLLRRITQPLAERHPSIMGDRSH
jgi:hypothetical protein